MRPQSAHSVLARWSGEHGSFRERMAPKHPSASPESPDEVARQAPEATAPALLNLKTLVFFAGAVLMGLEIAGSRVLAPHFGNSIFVWGSLIAIFLMAISIGNYLGGRLADQFPSHLFLNSICIAVALWIFGLAIFGSALCVSLAEAGMGEQSGPLVASLILFLAPSIGMGMVSPFAIRLATSSLATVGQVSGALYALSNTGSILGTMLTTFVLIPFIGLAAILKGLGVVLLVIAILTSPGIWNRKYAPNLFALLVVTGLLLWLPEARQNVFRPGEELVVAVSTPYHNIAVVDNTIDEVREMRFDQFTESAISTRPPHIALANYTDYFHLAFLLKPQLERTLFIGAGGAVGPRAFHMHDAEMEIDVIDIDPKVLELTRTHFFLQDDPRIRTIAHDGRIFVRDAQQYDSIILDAFTIGGRIPFHLVTQEFFTLCRDRLNDDGVFVMNINSALEGPQAGIFRSTYRTLKEVFPQVYVFKKYRHQNYDTDSANIILVGSNSKQRLAPADWQRLASDHLSDSYVKAQTLRAAVDDLVEDVPDVSAAPLFTDDYAPIETMPF